MAGFSRPVPGLSSRGVLETQSAARVHLLLLTSRARDYFLTSGDAIDFFGIGMIKALRALLAAVVLLVPASVAAQPQNKLPLPRFVSLRSDKVHVRIGPSQNHEIRWTFAKAGLPVEIIAEFENWRRIRDSDGADGWVHQALLSGRRTVLIRANTNAKTIPVYERANGVGSLIAELQPGVLANVRSCAKGWCRISGERFDGYILQTLLWGVYPDEVIE
jgi:SH3-like domain-containing protein